MLLQNENPWAFWPGKMLYNIPASQFAYQHWNLSNLYYHLAILLSGTTCNTGHCDVIGILSLVTIIVY